MIYLQTFDTNMLLLYDLFADIWYKHAVTIWFICRHLIQTCCYYMIYLQTFDTNMLLLYDLFADIWYKHAVTIWFICRHLIQTCCYYMIYLQTFDTNMLLLYDLFADIWYKHVVCCHYVFCSKTFDKNVFPTLSYRLSHYSAADTTHLFISRAPFQYTDCLFRHGITIININQSWDCLIFPIHGNSYNNKVSSLEWYSLLITKLYTVKPLV